MKVLHVLFYSAAPLRGNRQRRVCAIVAERWRGNQPKGRAPANTAVYRHCKRAPSHRPASLESMSPQPERHTSESPVLQLCGDFLVGSLSTECVVACNVSTHVSSESLQRGAAVNAGNLKDDNTPLHIAVTATAPEVAVDAVDLLLMFEADPDIKNLRGFTAMACATKHQKFGMIRETIVKWIDWRKAFAAIVQGEPYRAIITLLGTEGVKPNINHCNKDGTTLLHAAVRCRNVVRERAPWASLSRAVSRSGARTRECVCVCLACRIEGRCAAAAGAWRQYGPCH